MASALRSDGTIDSPFTGRFLVEVDAVQIGTFMEVNGLSVEMKTEEVVEGGQNGFVHKLPGRLQWPNIVLKRGVTNTDGLFTWLRQENTARFLSDAEVESSSDPHVPSLSNPCGAVIMLDSTGAEIRRWTFDGAMPVKWTGPTFASSSSDVATEELEIAHNGFIAGNAQ